MLELINRRRRQLHVHSVVYYFLNTSIISDATFDTWAKELVTLNEEHPEFLHKGYLPGLFVDWTGDTGMHLTLRDETMALAQQLVRYSQRLDIA